MPFHMVENPDGSTTLREVAGGSGSGEVRVVYNSGEDVSLGRAQSANGNGTFKTYVKVANETGVARYINVTGTTISAATSRP